MKHEPFCVQLCDLATHEEWHTAGCEPTEDILRYSVEHALRQRESMRLPLSAEEGDVLRAYGATMAQRSRVK